MRRWLALSAIAFLATAGWLALRDILRGYWSTHAWPYDSSPPSSSASARIDGML